MSFSKMGRDKVVGLEFVWLIVGGQDWKCVCASNVGL